MAMQCLRVIFISALLALLPGAAFAQTTWDVIQSFGIAGTSAIDCDQPISDTEPRQLIYLGTDGQVYRKYMRGAGYDDLFSIIEKAKAITAPTFETRWH